MSPNPSSVERRVIAIGGLLAAATLVLDLYTPLGVNDGMLYVVPVLLGFWVAPVHYTVTMAVVGGILTVAGFFFHPPTGDVTAALANRSLALLVIGATATLVRRYKRVADSLGERTARAQEYLDVAGVMIVELDARGIVALINKRGCDLLGYDEGEIIGKSWFDDFVPARLRDSVNAVFVKLMNGELEAVEYFENPVVTRSGEERIVRWHNALRRDGTGTIIGTLSSGDDVTGRRQAEEALRQSHQELADVKYALDQSAIIAVTDQRGIIKYVNDKFCEISKYSRDEALGQDHRIVNSGYHPKEFMRELWRTIANGGIWRGEIRNRAKDGTIYWVDTTIVPFLDESDKPYQYLAIHYDITERKRAEERLRDQAALTQLGQMAAVVAHEVRNPLAAVRGALQVVAGRLPAGSQDPLIINDVLVRLDTLNRLIEELLIFARPRPPKLAPVRLVPLLQKTAKLLAQDSALATVEVDIEAACGDLMLVADAELLQGVFLNLLINAAQATGGKGQIQMAVDAENGSCHIAVRDRGPGIPPDVRGRVFDPFFTTKHRGTGLGLSIAKRAVELHHGTIAVDCPAEGGTTVIVTLPLNPQAA